MPSNNEQRCQAILNVGDNQIQCTIPDREYEGDHKNISQKRIWKPGVTRAAPPPQITPRSDLYPKTTDDQRKLIKKVSSHWPYMDTTKSNAFMVLAYAKAYGRKHRDLVQDLEKAEEFCHVLLEAFAIPPTGNYDDKIAECARYFGREDIADMYDSGD